MRARLIEERRVVREHAAQVRLIHDERVVEALGAGRADPALRVRIGIGRAVGRAHDRDALAGEDHVEGWRELRVAIVDEEARWLLTILE